MGSGHLLRALLLAAIALAPAAAGASGRRPTLVARAEPVVVAVPGRGDAPVAIAAAVSLAKGATLLAFTASADFEARAFALEGPDRLVLDLPEVNFQLPPETGRTGRGLVRGFRYGLLGPGRSRVVIDLTGPATLRGVTSAEGPGGAGRIVTVEIAPVERAAFREAAAAERRAADASARTLPEAPITASSRGVVALDPGHGGIDPGALAAHGVVEKDVTLATALALRAELQGRGFKVVLTRDGDSFVSLNERVRIAREAGASLFVSLHADSLSEVSEVRGATVYTRAERASDAEAARIAERENRADANAGADGSEAPSEVSDILGDLTRRETRALSSQFAHGLVSALGPRLKLHRLPFRSAAFQVLKAYDMPSVLLELGYLSNPKDLEDLTSPEWRGRVAGAAAGAITRFLSRSAIPPEAERASLDAQPTPPR